MHQLGGAETSSEIGATDALLGAADLGKSSLDEVTWITGCKLVPQTKCPGIDLHGLSLVRVDLRGADLAGANLQNADLDSAWLENADLHGADLRGANLALTILRGANLAGVNLGGLAAATRNSTAPT